MQPLFRWRMERAASLQQIYSGLANFVRARRAYLDGVLAEVATRGPLRASELEASTPRKGGWWGWSDGKRALEFLFWAGLVTTRTREVSTRLVQAVHLEPGAEMKKTAASLAAELREVAEWLGLERITVARKGSLARALKSALND